MKIGFGVYEQVDDHESVIVSGCVGHVVCPPCQQTTCGIETPKIRKLFVVR